MAIALTYALVGCTSLLRAQAGGVRENGRLILRVESSVGGSGGVRLALPKGDSITFSPQTLLTGQDFAQLLLQAETASSYGVVGMLLPASSERLHAQNAGLVGKRVGVIIDGQLVSVWRIESPLAGRMLPLAMGKTKAAASRIAESLFTQK